MSRVFTNIHERLIYLLAWLLPQSSKNLILSIFSGVLSSFLSIKILRKLFQMNLSFFNFSQKYTDILAGLVAIDDYYKTGDYLVVIAALSSFIVFFILTSLYLNIQNRLETKKDIVEKLNFYTEHFFGALFFALFTVISFLGILSCFIMFRVEGNTQLEVLFSKIYSPVFFSFFGIYWIVLFFVNRNKTNESILSKMLLYSQVFSPLILSLGFLGQEIQDQTLFQHHLAASTTWFMLILFGLLSSLVLRKIFHLPALPKESNRWRFLNHSLSLVGIFSFAFFFAFRKAYPALPPDDFHFGEMSLPWNQIWQLGLSFGDEFIPIQGFLSLLYGMVNQLFFDGTALTFGLAEAATYPVLAGFVTLSTSLLVGPFWGCILGLTGALASNRLIFTFPAICILCYPPLVARSFFWLFTWLVVCAFSVLTNYGSGSAIVLATAPLAVFQFFYFFQSNQHQTLKKTILESSRFTKFSFFIGLIALFYMGRLLPSIVTFLKESGGSGSGFATAYGMGLFQHFQGSGYGVFYRFFGGFLGVVGLFYLFIFNYLKNKNLVLFFFCTASMLCYVAMIPYGFGRIDPENVSRVGMISALLLGYLFPLGFILSQPKQQVYLLLGVFVLVADSRRVVGFNWMSPKAAFTQALAPIEISPDFVFTSFEQTGIKNIGEGFVNPQHLKTVQAIKKSIDQILSPEETYFDLTNRSALYYYLDRKAPAPIISHYIAFSDLLQERSIRAIEKSPPPLVLIDPAQNFDYWTASVRAFRLYDWFMTHDYVYWKPSKEAAFLISKQRAQKAQVGLLRPIQQIEGLEKIFATGNFYSLPIAWGRSFELMKFRFEEGEHRDFALLKAHCKNSEDPLTDLTLSWKTDQGFKKTLLNYSTTEAALVPLASFPSWRLGPAQKKLKINPGPQSKCKAVVVDETRFFNLKAEAHRRMR